MPSREIPIYGDVTPAMFAKKNKLVSSCGETERDKTEFILLIVGWVLFGVCFIAALCASDQKGTQEPRCFFRIQSA